MVVSRVRTVGLVLTVLTRSSLVDLAGRSNAVPRESKRKCTLIICITCSLDKVLVVANYTVAFCLQVQASLNI